MEDMPQEAAVPEWMLPPQGDEPDEDTLEAWYSCP